MPQNTVINHVKYLSYILEKRGSKLTRIHGLKYIASNIKQDIFSRFRQPQAELNTTKEICAIRKSRVLVLSPLSRILEKPLLSKEITIVVFNDSGKQPLNIQLGNK